LQYSQGTYVKYEYGQRPIPDGIEWRLALADKDPSGLALLLLEQTKKFGWTEDQERAIGNEIVSMFDLAQTISARKSH